MAYAEVCLYGEAIKSSLVREAALVVAVQRCMVSLRGGDPAGRLAGIDEFVLCAAPDNGSVCA